MSGAAPAPVSASAPHVGPPPYEREALGREPARPAAAGRHTRHARPPWARPSPFRRFLRLLMVLVCLLLLAGGGTYAWADLRLDRGVDLRSVGAPRPADGRGTTYLVVGSDSRAGLSAQDQEDLHTGSTGGGRTDSMMLLHTGAGGTTLVSLPRDSWVTAPSYLSPETGKRHRPEKNKLNAAYALGGPRLLVATVEHNTGVRVDHYAEIGLGGFGVVDAVGGVEMCVDRAVRDEKSGLDMAKGCQALTGGQALAFVRQRHQEAEGDLGRTKNQQKFLAALARRASEPLTALNPLKSYPALNAALDALTVDEDMDLDTLAGLVTSMRTVTSGGGRRFNVPVGRGLSTPKGDAVEWDRERAEALFERLG